MTSLKTFFHKILHHPNTLPWVLISTMVAIMASYNTIIRYGLSEKMFMRVIIVYPIIVAFIYYLRAYVTLPIALKLHQYFPSVITKRIPKHISVTLLVIAFNVSIMMVLFTEMHRQLYPSFFPSYFDNWVKTFFVAVPVFFLIVRPTLIYIFNHLKIKYPLLKVVDEL
ncbi:hypothetical protein [Leuconostoc rapi]|uniref:hypothetical protein n=1 Tax=Leuconostoc rapi TaxID=1406906 RepID=UPI00195A190A|nr:hypothetical protein [Leuconostoc rapi]MBM7434849.1 hypothetical protein [Leuconostoc rapi]